MSRCSQTTFIKFSNPRRCCKVCLCCSSLILFYSYLFYCKVMTNNVFIFFSWDINHKSYSTLSKLIYISIVTIYRVKIFYLLKVFLHLTCFNIICYFTVALNGFSFYDYFTQLCNISSTSCNSYFV